MDRKDIEDVSAYMLFEATGDSEVDYNPIMDDDVAREFPKNVVDDAESCSYDASEICDIGNLNGYESCDGDADVDVKKEDEDDEEKKEELVYGTSYCTDDEVEDEEHSIRKPNAVDSVSEHEVVDEREKNRLFWEACLAS